ncbi:MAG: hydroxymethylglutaryl-CoA synthase [Candidatus Altiarchaeales archaeon]|nr:hydroxymethylglutaryl-CoA synthase [Candidatus Altiarchaeales archaeon]
MTSKTDSTGIVGWGAYVPRFRVTAHEIAQIWGDEGDRMSRGLNVVEKSVPGMDEDVVTISVEAARNAVAHAGVEPQTIGAIYVGSESHPYVVKPTATIVAEAISATPDLTAADMEFACKAGTAGMQACFSHVKSGNMTHALAVGADTSQGKPGDALEYTASAGGAAYILGRENVLAEIQDTLSFTTDTPDFWRREGQEFPRHGSRFTGAPAYFRHVSSAAKNILEKNNLTPKDFDFAVFHQPNGRFPRRVAAKLGFEKKQVEEGLLTPLIGNTYSGATPLGLSAVLDVAKPGHRILAVSYGSGAGSDAFIIEATELISDKRNPKPIRPTLEDKTYISYAQYAKYKSKILEVGLKK